VVVPVLGTLTNDQRLAVQVVAADPDRVRTVPVDSVGHKVRNKVGGKTGWIEVTVALADSGLDAPSAVRVLAQDRVAGPDSWFAVAQPRLTVPRPVTSVIAGRPVFADQVSAGLWPCQDQIAVRHGMVQAPRMRLRIADGLVDATIHNATFADNGGTLLQVNRTATFVELPSQLIPPGVPTLGWGHVEEVVYTHPVGLVDLRVDQQRRAGWTRLPTLIGQPYTGRAYTG
jgi:arabinosyltransferase B/arabinosyltransferase C